MNSNPLTFWDHVQLTLLRWLAIFLGLMDRLFNVHWGERLLGRLANRWQTQLVELDVSLARLEEERQQLNRQTESLAIQAAAIYLGSRQLTHGELRFDPTDLRDEEVLDATIDLLVKERLASIETETVGAERYLYHVEPDWPAIRQRLEAAADRAGGETADWFREGLAFLDEALPIDT